MTHKSYFSTRMKLADLISANYHIILTLPRFGIPLGVEDYSVKEICQRHHINPNFFILICNVYSFDNYIPTFEEIQSIEMNLLVSYLMASHKYYIHERIPHIEQHLHHIADKVENKYGDMLKQFFNEYKAEVINHFKYEEEKVFPYIKLLNTSQTDNNEYKIEEFITNHSNIEDKLSDLTQIIYKYLPGNSLPEETIELVFDVMELSSDLNKHTIIEDKILVPYIESMERRIL